MMFEDLLAAFAQHRERDAEAAFAASVPLMDWNSRSTGAPRAERGKLRGNVREAASLRRRLASRHKPVERVQNRADRLHRIRRGIHADHRVATSIEQAFESAASKMPPMSSAG